MGSDNSSSGSSYTESNGERATTSYSNGREWAPNSDGREWAPNSDGQYREAHRVGNWCKDESGNWHLSEEGNWSSSEGNREGRPEVCAKEASTKEKAEESAAVKTKGEADAARRKAEEEASAKKTADEAPAIQFAVAQNRNLQELGATLRQLFMAARPRSEKLADRGRATRNASNPPDVNILRSKDLLWIYRQILVAKRVRHEGVTRCVSCFKDDGGSFNLVFPRYPVSSEQWFFVQLRQENFSSVIGAAQVIVGALSALHAAGIAPEEVKPTNIVFESTAADCRPKLINVGGGLVDGGSGERGGESAQSGNNAFGNPPAASHLDAGRPVARGGITRGGRRGGGGDRGGNHHPHEQSQHTTRKLYIRECVAPFQRHEIHFSPEEDFARLTVGDLRQRIVELPEISLDPASFDLCLPLQGRNRHQSDNPQPGRELEDRELLARVGLGAAGATVILWRRASRAEFWRERVFTPLMSLFREMEESGMTGAPITMEEVRLRLEQFYRETTEAALTASIEEPEFIARKNVQEYVERLVETEDALERVAGRRAAIGALNTVCSAILDAGDAERLVERDRARCQLSADLQVYENDTNSAAVLLERLRFKPLPFSAPAMLTMTPLNQIRERFRNSAADHFRRDSVILNELRAHHRRLLREVFRAKEDLKAFAHHVSAQNAFAWDPSDGNPNYPYLQAQSRVLPIAEHFLRIKARPYDQPHLLIPEQLRLREEMHRANVHDLVRWFPELHKLIDFRATVLWTSLRFDLNLQSFMDVETTRRLDEEVITNRTSYRVALASGADDKGGMLMYFAEENDLKTALCNMVALASTDEVEALILRSARRWGTQETSRSRPYCECLGVLPMQPRGGIAVPTRSSIPGLGVLLIQPDLPCSSADWFQHQLAHKNLDIVVEGIIRIIYIVRGCNAAGIHFPQVSLSQFFRCKSLEAEDLPTLVDLWCLPNQDRPIPIAAGDSVIRLSRLLAALLVGCDLSCTERIWRGDISDGYGTGLCECLGLDDLPPSNVFWKILKQVKEKLRVTDPIPSAAPGFIPPRA
jgi:hypothetical protein